MPHRDVSRGRSLVGDARRRALYTSVMSGNRTPKRSSFGPTSGLLPMKLMWSSITIKVPGDNDVLMPPAALVSTSIFTPRRAQHAHENVTVVKG